MGPSTGEIVLWARNLTNSGVTTFPLLVLTGLASSDFQAARTYGVDLSLKF
jgi:hypothetical protein